MRSGVNLQSPCLIHAAPMQGFGKYQFLPVSGLVGFVSLLKLPFFE